MKWCETNIGAGFKWLPNTGRPGMAHGREAVSHGLAPFRFRVYSRYVYYRRQMKTHPNALQPQRPRYVCVYVVHTTTSPSLQPCTGHGGSTDYGERASTNYKDCSSMKLITVYRRRWFYPESRYLGTYYFEMTSAQPPNCLRSRSASVDDL